MKKFISGSFVTLSLLCALGLRCSATKSPNIPENVKNIILQDVQNNTEQKIINDQILNFLKSMSTKDERIEAFWELAKIIAEIDCFDLLKMATKLDYKDSRKYIETMGDYDIYYSENKGTVCALGTLSFPFMINRPHFMLIGYDSKFDYTFERFFSVSDKDISTPPIINSLIK